MKSLQSKISNITKDQLIKLFTITVILIIFLDMDTYIYPLFNALNIPLPSTILAYIWLPIYVIIVFLVLEKNKKKIFFVGAMIITVYILYFIVHHYLSKDLASTLYLTNNFFYSIKYEITYMFILILPLFYVYVIYRLEPSFTQVEKIMVIVAMMISIPIFLGNVFLISPSTYVGWTKSNIFSWFSGIYDTFLPRQLATKAFFSEGNTTGIVLFITFPFMLNLMHKLNANWKITTAVIIQVLAMYCLATRVTTYGVLILMIGYFIILAVMVLIKKEKFSLKFILIYLTIFLVFLGMFKFTPAYVNQQIDTDNDNLILSNESHRQELKGEVYKPNLTSYSADFINYYVHIFTDNAFLLSIPEVYYEEIYDYRIDPIFWVDLIFNYDFYERSSGRDFERIFSEYEWDKLTTPQKLVGFSYSTFMNGGILLEQDFVMQVYTHGYVGFAILVMPWLIILLIVLVLALKRIKYILNMDILICGMALCGGYICAYSSGHTLDELFSSIILAILAGKLLLMVRKSKKESIKK